MSRNIIYTFSGNQLPAIDNKKTLKNDKVCRGWGGGGGLTTVVIRQKFAKGKQRLLAIFSV